MTAAGSRTPRTAAGRALLREIGSWGPHAEARTFQGQSWIVRIEAEAAAQPSGALRSPAAPAEIDVKRPPVPWVTIRQDAEGRERFRDCGCWKTEDGWATCQWHERVLQDHMKVRLAAAPASGQAAETLLFNDGSPVFPKAQPAGYHADPNHLRTQCVVCTPSLAAPTSGAAEIDRPCASTREESGVCVSHNSYWLIESQRCVLIAAEYAQLAAPQPADAGPTFADLNAADFDE